MPTALLESSDTTPLPLATNHSALPEKLFFGLPSNPRSRRIVLILWLLVFAAMPVWIAFDSPGWDLDVCYSAIRSVIAGGDPYTDGIAMLQHFHAQPALHPEATPPFIYVYSPLTLPFLRVIGALPIWLGGLYWFIYIPAVLAQIWVGLQAAEGSERRYFVYLAPLAAFFPGLLADGTVLSGNVAHILYGLILLAAVVGWRRGSWRWFYIATLAASCIKAPFLMLLAIPLLSARRQWLPTAITGSLGVALFALPSLIWPALFKHYLKAVELMFSYSHDFGCSPSGLFSDFLWSQGVPYARPGFVFYLWYAIPLFLILLYLSRSFMRGGFSIHQWIPVLLTGVVLLNPRLIEYDVAALALPLALIGWRVVSSCTTHRNAIIVLSVLFVIANCFAAHRWELRKMIDGPLLVLFFMAGSLNLLLLSSESAARARQDQEARLSTV